jgi:hypothetical protein
MGSDCITTVQVVGVLTGGFAGAGAAGCEAQPETDNITMMSANATETNLAQGAFINWSSFKRS